VHTQNLVAETVAHTLEKERQWVARLVNGGQEKHAFFSMLILEAIFVLFILFLLRRVRPRSCVRACV